MCMGVYISTSYQGGQRNDDDNDNNDNTTTMMSSTMAPGVGVISSCDLPIGESLDPTCFAEWMVHLNKACFIGLAQEVW